MNDKDKSTKAKQIILTLNPTGDRVHVVFGDVMLHEIIGMLAIAKQMALSEVTIRDSQGQRADGHGKIRF